MMIPGCSLFTALQSLYTLLLSLDITCDLLPGGPALTSYVINSNFGPTDLLSCAGKL